jgi:hypothetical protein
MKPAKVKIKGGQKMDEGVKITISNICTNEQEIADLHSKKCFYKIVIMHHFHCIGNKSDPLSAYCWQENDTHGNTLYAFFATL